MPQTILDALYLEIGEGEGKRKEDQEKAKFGKEETEIRLTCLLEKKEAQFTNCPMNWSGMASLGKNALELDLEPGEMKEVVLKLSRKWQT